MKIYYDNLQEGQWFKELHPSFHNAELLPINGNTENSPISKALEYDRPDIILVDKEKAILVVERTIEVPTGHNVGQRFARLAAAAEAKIPLVYFGPFMARKHGGITQGPRYMNLRLFYTLDVLAQINKAAVTAINWPVDKNCELLRTSEKDLRMKEYIKLFLSEYEKHGIEGINEAILRAPFQEEQAEKRESFINKYVRSPKDYDIPPPSVQILDPKKMARITYKCPKCRNYNHNNKKIIIQTRMGGYFCWNCEIFIKPLRIDTQILRKAKV